MAFDMILKYNYLRGDAEFTENFSWQCRGEFSAFFEVILLSKCKPTDRMRKRAHKKRKLLKEIYGKECYICKKAVADTIDHVVPLSKGGTNEIGNLRPACYSCNWEKGDKIYDID